MRGAGLALWHLLEIQRQLLEGAWLPGPYTTFPIRAPPKIRLISAAPFADRVVHHALCNIIAPSVEAGFIADTYANRCGKGTHRAVDRLQFFAARKRYVLRLDIVKHFPSIDHAILLDILRPGIRCPRTLALVATIVESGDRILEQEYEMAWFAGDDLFAALRPRGLPIGNLTSQFWSNCCLNPIDHFVARELGCRAYLRYVDDMALFSDSKGQLWEWKGRIVERLGARLRLTIHESSAQVLPVEWEIPSLGFVVYPDYRRVKARKVVESTQRLGWVNHVRYADTWRLREQVLDLSIGWSGGAGPSAAALVTPGGR